MSIKVKAKVQSRRGANSLRGHLWGRPWGHSWGHRRRIVGRMRTPNEPRLLSKVYRDRRMPYRPRAPASTRALALTGDEGIDPTAVLRGERPALTVNEAGTLLGFLSSPRLRTRGQRRTAHCPPRATACGAQGACPRVARDASKVAGVSISGAPRALARRRSQGPFRYSVAPICARWEATDRRIGRGPKFKHDFNTPAREDLFCRSLDLRRPVPWLLAGASTTCR